MKIGILPDMIAFGYGPASVLPACEKKKNFLKSRKFSRIKNPALGRMLISAPTGTLAVAMPPLVVPASLKTPFQFPNDTIKSTGLRSGSSTVPLLGSVPKHFEGKIAAFRKCYPLTSGSSSNSGVTSVVESNLHTKSTVTLNTVKGITKSGLQVYQTLLEVQCYQAA